MQCIKLFYWPGASSLAAHIVAEETGLNYEPVKVDFSVLAQRQEPYLSINPKGRVPALVIDGQTYTECPAVMFRLATLVPEKKLWPDQADEAVRCVEWLSWGASTIHVAYAHIRRAERYAHSENGKKEVIEAGYTTCRLLWPQIEEKLSLTAGLWALGEDFSVVDAYLFVFWNWGRAEALHYDMTKEFPTWTRIMKLMAKRPAFQRVLQREGINLP